MENTHVLMEVLHQTHVHYKNLHVDPLVANTVCFAVKEGTCTTLFN